MSFEESQKRRQRLSEKSQIIIDNLHTIDDGRYYNPHAPISPASMLG